MRRKDAEHILNAFVNTVMVTVDNLIEDLEASVVVRRSATELRNVILDAMDDSILPDQITRCDKCIHFDPEEPLPGCTLFDFSAGPDQAETGFCKWGTPKEDDDGSRDV